MLKTIPKPLDIWDKFFIWAKGTFRVIFLINLLAVFGIFGYRFSVDRRLNDLSDELKSLGAKVELYKNDEKKIREIQDSVGKYDNAYKASSSLSSLLISITNQVPQGLQVQVSIDKKRVNINGIGTRDDISVLEKNLKSSPQLKNVVVGNLENNKSKLTFDTNLASLVFSINADISAEVSKRE